MSPPFTPPSGEKIMGAPIRLTDQGQIQIDLRTLPPPQPMLAVLELVARLGDDQVVTVVHNRDPIYLYPELAEIGWELTLVRAEDGALYFQLRKGK